MDSVRFLIRTGCGLALTLTADAERFARLTDRGELGLKELRDQIERELNTFGYWYPGDRIRIESVTSA